MTRSLGILVSLSVLRLFLNSGIASEASIPKSASAGSVRAADAEREARIDYLKKRAVRVRSIDPENRNFIDLESLRGMIGDRRVVMLGESSHGDGATFAAKARLVQFLHERMGFDVLAFEGGFYDLRKVWSALRAGEDPTKALQSGLDEVWSASRQNQTLWSYLSAQSKTSHPLELSGFDMQFTGSVSRDYLLKDLRDYLSRAGLPPDAAGAAARVTDALALMLEDPAFIQNRSEFKKIKPEDQAAVLFSARSLGEALGSLPPVQEPGMIERSFWIQFLNSGASYLKQSWRINPELIEKTVLDWAINLRDRQMGENLVWLAKRAYPTRKIIVWAANAHIIRHRDFFMFLYEPLIPMGDWVDKAIGPEVYALGFTSYKGRWGEVGMADSKEVDAAPPDSLEDLLFSAGFEYAAVDFRNLGGDGAWLRAPLSCRVLKYRPLTTDWTRMLDGLFFIKEMFPSTRIEKK